MCLCAQEDRTAICAIRLTIGSDIADIKVSDTGDITSVSVNDNDYTNFFPSDSVKILTNHLVPQFVISDTASLRRRYSRIPQGPLTTPDGAIYELFSRNLHGNVLSRTIYRFIDSVTYRPKDSFISSLSTKPVEHASWKSFVDRVQGGQLPTTIERMRLLYLVRELPQMLWFLEIILRNIAYGISYVGPARATTDRYYRMQELAIDQIDPAGTNFAMFMNSLSTSEQIQFEAWTKEYIGYSITPRRSVGHVSLMLNEGESGAGYNLADVGYGLSQIFPVMAQIWLNVRRRAIGDSGFRIVAIEQPELHLHPEFQTKIADALVGAVVTAKQNRNTLSLIVETHSEALINRLGELIAAGNLAQSEVAIHLFEKEPSDEVTSVRMAQFDSDGVLENWPFGFFSGRQPLPTKS